MRGSKCQSTDSQGKKLVRTTPIKQNSGTFSGFFLKFSTITPVTFIWEPLPPGMQAARPMQLGDICSTFKSQASFIRGLIVWHFCKASDSRKIERLQERGLRAVCKDHHATYAELLKRAQLPTLKNRRLQDVCTLMYKVKHKKCPAYISNIFYTRSTSYSLRQTDFSIPRFNTVTYGQHSLRYLGPKLWEKLPKDIRSAKTLNNFKIAIRKFDVSSLSDDGCMRCSCCSSI